MAERYPEIEPYEHGMLDVGDGQRLYWEVCGSRNGRPAVVLHGGPGSGCTPEHRRYFDPAAYGIVLFDQRGAGRSVPHAADPAVDLSTNTTQHLIRDIQLLREHLGVERWLVWGSSWGATLALAYAETHPQRVAEVVLASVTMTRPADIHWLYHGVGRFFPEEWARFRDGVPMAERGGDLVAAYYRLLNHPDSAVREKAARDWYDWGDAVVSLSWCSPELPEHVLRVMQGNPNSPFPNSQAPYVRWQRNGQPLDVNGNVLPTANSPDAHIPLGDFRFLPEIFG